MKKQSLGSGAGRLDFGGRTAGKEPHPVLGTVHELGVMLISRRLSTGTGLDAPVGVMGRVAAEGQ